MNLLASTSKSKAPRSGFQERRPSSKRQQVDYKKLYSRAIKDAFIKFNPQYVIKNPVIFLVWVSIVVSIVLTINPSLSGTVIDANQRLFNGLIAVISFCTLWLANFAEAFAQAKGKARADALRLAKANTSAKKLSADGTIAEVSSNTLQRGDTVYVVAGDIIPADGEVIMGVASVDESAITGESAPVLKESGTEGANSVTGGTRIVADELIILITVNPGKGFIDRMITLLQGTQRRKTQNEITLRLILIILSLLFLCVIVTLPALAYYLNISIDLTILVALLVALTPVAASSLLNAAGIASMESIAHSNVITTSPRAVEAAGNINTLVLDKTGTITLGNRLAEGFIPVHNHSIKEVAYVALAASIFDDTQEGKSTVRLAQRLGARVDFDHNYAVSVEFSSITRMSGTNLPNGSIVRKGAVDSIKEFVGSLDGDYNQELNSVYQMVAQQGGTPLAVCLDNEIYGIIYLKDIIKPGIRDRFYQLQKLGVHTIMITGDNHITASVIAREAGVKEFIANANPDQKIITIAQQQAQGKLVAMTGDGTNDAPALAQANIGIAMNTGTQAAKEAAKIVDLDSDPTKLLDIIAISKQLLLIRGALMTFFITNNVAKYIATIPVIFAAANLQKLNVMNLTSTKSAVLSTLIYNALIIPALLPLALKRMEFQPMTANKMLQRNIFIYGVSGIFVPFIVIKLIDILITFAGLG